MLRCLHSAVIALLLPASLAVAESDHTNFAKWATVELSFHGPKSRAQGEPNPFDIALDVTFTGPNDRRYVIPGFYDGDGDAGPDGNVWKVRFAAGSQGQWTYMTKSPAAQLDRLHGQFRVTAVPPRAAGFWRWGRLEAVGTAANRIRYLKFRDGPYWLKAGCDDPENFLGQYRHFNTLAERKAAVDYLAGKGINSLYIMTHNIGGDDNDVWPWLGSTPGEAKNNARPGNVRFDVAKLTQWRELFEHMQARGVVPYLVLEDDSAWTGYDHQRYYREIVARFGDLPAVLFNLGEELNENYPLPESLALARHLKQLDPYGHPLGIHNVNDPLGAYIDSPHVDFTAIQTGSPGIRRGLDHATEHNRIAARWIEQCRQRRARMLVVGFDEGRPEHDRRAWWSAYLGGGVWEAHVLPPYDHPHTAWEQTWIELGGARAFMESLPFWEMQPHNEFVKAGRAFCLAEPGVCYALYLPAGRSVSVELTPQAEYEAEWWNPAQGNTGRFQDSRGVSGGVRSFSAPSDGDWALRIIRVESRNAASK